MSQKQFTIAPSFLTTSAPIVKGKARENLLKEKRIENLYKPDLNKSSCNHCISKAVGKHDQVMDQFTHLSVQSTQATNKVSAFDKAASEFLTVTGGDGDHNKSQSGQYLAANFSMSHIPTTQFDSHSHLPSADAHYKKMAYSKLAQNAPNAIKGILAQCDTHGKISKYTNQEFGKEMEKQHKETIANISSMTMGIHSVLEAEDEVPLWKQVIELQKLEAGSDLTVIEDMVKFKRNINPEAIIEQLKYEQKFATAFKPSKFKYAPEIETFLKQKFHRSND